MWTPNQNLSHSIMRILLSVVVCVGILYGTTPHLHAAPKLAFNQPAWDFGYVPQHAYVSHRFWVHNDGDEPLTIDRIDVGCWCTGTSQFDDPIAPGDSAEFIVSLNTSIIQGPVRKWVKLFTSVATEEHERLWIRAYVVPDEEPTGVYRVTPKIVDWPVARTDSAEGWVETRLDRAQFNIENLTENDVTVVTDACCDPCIDSVVVPSALRGNSSITGVIYANNPTDSATCAAPSVTLTLIASDTARITIPIVIE